MLNGINLEGLETYRSLIAQKPTEAISSYGITAKWMGGVKTQIHTHDQMIGSALSKKDFTFEIDEPLELLGNNSNPTPQDYLLGGLAGCMMVGFVVEASIKGIQLENIELTITGNLNLLGFLNVDDKAPVGFDAIEFQYHVEGDGSEADYDEIIKKVQQYSPNYRTITDSILVTAKKIATV